jgi:hypothetical protein
VTELAYQVRDASRITREIVHVYAGKSFLVQYTTRFARSEPDVVYTVSWRAPRRARKGLRFCVRAWDRRGNASRRSCARIVVR